MINKYILRHEKSISYNNTDITKMFNVGRSLLARSIKHYGLIDSLREPEDYNKTLQELREIHQSHENIGYCHAVGYPRAKVTKAKKVRLRHMLKH